MAFLLVYLDYYTPFVFSVPNLGWTELQLRSLKWA